MMLVKILMALSAACLLAACGVSTRSAEPSRLVIAAPPAEMVQDIPAPARLPARAMTQAEVERAWAGDRANLATGRKRHRSLVDWISARDAALRGGPVVIAPGK